MKGFLKLEQAIQEANGWPRRILVRRTKLADLARGEDVPLHVSELRALDAYFSKEGHSLADEPIFEKTSILESLEENGKACFILGSRTSQRERVNDLRRWDCRAMAVLLHDVGRLTRRIDFEFEDVLSATPARKLGAERWHHYLRNDGPSLIGIGSPRASLATELILAEMFGIERPFTPRSERDGPLPFYFLWPKGTRPEYRSRFELNSEDIRKEDAALAKELEKGKAMALKAGGKVYRVPCRFRDALTYGVVAAQRRRDGRLLLVVAGINGPATFAAAEHLKSIDAVLPHASAPGEHGPVLWAVVEATVTTEPGRRGDNRAVSRPKLADGPSVWR